MGAAQALIVILAMSGIAGVIASLLLNLPPAPICTCRPFPACRSSSRPCGSLGE